MRILLLLFPLLFLSCFRETPKVGILFDNLENERWIKDKELLTHKFAENNYKVMFRNANGDPDKQYVQALEMIDSGVSALIVVAVDLFKSSAIIDIAHQNKIKVISYDRLMKNSKPDVYISFDNVEVGKLQAEYLTKVCPTGNYAVIGGSSSDNNAFLLRIGQMSILQPLVEKGDIKIVYDQLSDNWSIDAGYQHMLKILKNFKVNAVIAANDQLAVGAVRAMHEVDTSLQVYMSGQDATLEACKNILSGDQTMTVYKSIEIITDKTVDITRQLVNGIGEFEGTTGIYNGKNTIPSILITPTVVNRKTMDLTVIAEGHLNREDLIINIDNLK